MTERFKRVFVIVLDSLGIGGAKDAEEYGDAGANTLGHISKSVESFEIPNLQKLGLANLCGLKQVPAVERPNGYFATLCEKSKGKDTMTGHWEMMGLCTAKPFITFTEHGFPTELIQELERRTGHKVIGNKSAAGTAIIDEYGEEEIATGNMIVYTSADSVMQICGNEETFGLEELYRCCRIARELTMKEEWKVGRVIARPYVGRHKGEFVRTKNRHDYAVEPFGRTALNALADAGYDVIGIGKIYDIFAGEGITEKILSKSSVHGMEQTIEVAGRDFHGLCFVNLVDFDTLWGHQRKPEGYAREIERFDEKLGVLMENLRKDDLLILTADHGNDPTYRGTDHTRENVPFLAYSKAFFRNGDLTAQEVSTQGGCASSQVMPTQGDRACERKLPVQDSFAVIGATVCDNFGVAMPEGTIGSPILDELK